MMEFQEWPKTPRLDKPVIYTEKIDGTNGAVVILPFDPAEDDHPNRGKFQGVTASDGTRYLIGAQSRKRLITPEDDNYGFAAWVWENADSLVEVLGEGRHFGEWWGAGIQRTYGLKSKRFSLFNIRRWNEKDELTNMPMFTPRGELAMVPGLETVPLLQVTPRFDTKDVEQLAKWLEDFGSMAARGFPKPEGIIAYHIASGQAFKHFVYE